MNRLALALVLVAASAACSSTDSIEAAGTSAEPIVGGKETLPCAWPTTVDFKADFGDGATGACTATLVHPRMISLAAHCLEDGEMNQRAIFGDTDDPGHDGRIIPISKCVARDAGVEGGEDFAFCLLSEAVDIPIIPVLFGCETSILKEGQDVVLVGFGNIEANTPSPNGHKRWVHAKVDDVRSRDIDIGDPMHQNCFGDSGGPAFVQLADGTWRVFGATSTTNTPACASLGTWSLIHPYVAWVEEKSGLDITPCFDAATGAWAPGPGCTGVPLNPEATGGTWSNMCVENQTLSGPLASCGDAGAPPGVDAGARDAPRSEEASVVEGGNGGSSGAGGAGGASGSAAGGTTSGSGGTVTSTVATTTTGGADAGPPRRTSGAGDLAGGCDCRASRHGPDHGYAFFGLALALLRRRRRRSL